MFKNILATTMLMTSAIDCNYGGNINVSLNDSESTPSSYRDFYARPALTGLCTMDVYGFKVGGKLNIGTAIELNDNAHKILPDFLNRFSTNIGLSAIVFAPINGLTVYISSGLETIPHADTVGWKIWNKASSEHVAFTFSAGAAYNKTDSKMILVGVKFTFNQGIKTMPSIGLTVDFITNK